MKTDTNTKKNHAKYELYALAFRMIDDALQHGCPLQAIAVEESILTDRLSSTLNAGRVKASPKTSLGKALGEWKPKSAKSSPNANAALFDGEMEKMYPSLRQWWDDRCALLHAIVKSSQGEAPALSPDAFVALANKTAKTGLALSRRVDNWTRRRIRAAKSAAKTNKI